MSQTQNRSRSNSPTDEPPAYVRGDFSRKYEVELNEQLRKTSQPASSEASIISPTSDEPGYAKETTLLRGLQVPARFSYVSSGFKYPKILASNGVSKEHWSAFTDEITKCSHLSPSQWLTTIGGAAGTWLAGGMVVGFLGAIPAAVVGHKMRRRREESNFIAAAASGVLRQCVNRWNQTFFVPKGLSIRVDIPGDCTDLEDMDVSTSKLFKYESAAGSPTSESGPSEGLGVDKKKLKYEAREGRTRMKAAFRARVVIIPLNPAKSRTSSPSRFSQNSPRVGDGADDEEMSLAPTEVTEEEVTLFGKVLRRGNEWYPDEPKP
ncbi:hypothetical protein MMC20_002184 [Loxospora ochrophaea]|nr:hypothetical protein [Loxospora ochrophaea]